MQSPFLLFSIIIAMLPHSVFGQTTFSRESKLETGKANLYFFRAKNQATPDALVEIFLGGRRVGLLDGGEYFVLSILPGSYTLTANSPVGSSHRYISPSSIEVQPNVEYFVEIRETERTETKGTLLLVPVDKSFIPVPVVSELSNMKIRRWEIAERYFDQPPVEGIGACRKVDAYP